MNYEYEIQLHYPSLHKDIQKCIQHMPDFRPISTIQRMRRVINEEGNLIPEPQNNWRLLYEELGAMSQRKKDSDLFTILYTGNNIELLEYHKDSKEFAYTYPGLLWFLTKSGSQKAVRCFIMSVGFLDERAYPFFRTMVEELSINDLHYLIPYIKDKETALFLYDRFSSFKLLDEVESIGEIYWSTIIMEKENIKSTDRAYDLIERAIALSSVNTVMMLLKSPLFDMGIKRFPNVLIKNAILSENKEIFSLLYKDGRIPIRNEDVFHVAQCSTLDMLIFLLNKTSFPIGNCSAGLLHGAIDKNNLSMVDILLTDPRIDPSTHNNNVFAILLLMKNKEMMKKFLQNPRFRPMEGARDMFDLLLTPENEDILDLILSHPNTKVEEYRRIMENYIKEERSISTRFKNYAFECLVKLVVRITYKIN